jgi:hypothetical protein
MSIPTVAELIPILQVAIGPVILISGVGLLVLSMTNRLGRVIDRSRILSQELREELNVDREWVVAQLEILSRRAGLIQLAIIFASTRVLLAALLIVTLFFTALFGLETAWLIIIVFIGGMVSLIGSLVIFILDINQSLVALRLELDEVDDRTHSSSEE